MSIYNKIFSIIFLYIFISTNITAYSTSLCNEATIQWNYLQQLTQSTSFLSSLNKKKYCYSPCNIIIHTDHIQIDSIQFFNSTIKTCIQEMLNHHSLNPLLIVLKKATYYQHAYKYDQQFFRELFLLAFTIYKQILFHECSCNNYSPKAITLNDILIISDKINQLPIAEILNTIEMLVIELPPFLEKYEFTSTITWKEWFKKYWWVPPVFGVWFGLRILFYLQKAQASPSVTLQLLVTTQPTESEINDG